MPHKAQADIIAFSTVTEFGGVCEEFPAKYIP